MKFQIIPITNELIEGYWEALDRVAREQKYLAFLEAPPIHTTKNFVSQNINGQWPHVVALYQGKVIGWCDISSLDRPVFDHIGSLGIGVVEEFRGQGVGAALIKAALHQAKQKGLTRIELTVREKNSRAITLYEKMGFKHEGVHKNGIRVNGQYENHVFMALLFED